MLFPTNKKKGFTVIEIFITLSVIAVVSAISIYYYNDYVEDARITVRITNEKLVNDAIQRYYKEHMAYPKYMWQDDSIEDISKKINRGLDSALAGYFVNRKVSDILLEGSGANAYDVFFRVSETRKRDNSANIDNSTATDTWKMAKNLRFTNKDFLVHEVRIADSDSGITANTFNNLEKFNFPLILDSVPLNSSHEGYNTIAVNQELDIKMVCCPKGRFLMGAPADELGRRTNETAHWVTITKDFLISKYEITQKQYKIVMGTNPSYFTSDENRPVETVSYDDAIAFCNKLNTEYSRLVPYGYKFDLPTEAQWEYACRAGTTTSINNGENITTAADNAYCPNLDKVAWYNKSNNSNKNPHFVGDPRKAPNAWGIYDMHGNVHEFVKDLRQVNGNKYPDYPEGEAVDPIVTAGNQNCRRGGCYDSHAYRCRSASRDGFAKGNKDKMTGFRVVLVSTE